MYIISIIIVLVIFVEVYSISFRYEKKHISKKTGKIQHNYEENKELKFNKYFIKEGINVYHNPGKIRIDKNYNIIIKYNDEDILMEQNKTYHIQTDFTLETININDEYIIYKYIEE